ncbi:hypothetical protein QFC24_006463 [Naganishia onofrii]|uniref:Uncharacterized protein n=1 Tax=Naganishia onofrii TaxID=1851511 RepID=A0ACC2X020_9TREE|nr:hypothetical protein QFC24_006463 [Naganishia onofrii]
MPPKSKKPKATVNDYFGSIGQDVHKIATLAKNVRPDFSQELERVIAAITTLTTTVPTARDATGDYDGKKLFEVVLKELQRKAGLSENDSDDEGRVVRTHLRGSSSAMLEDEDIHSETATEIDSGSDGQQIIASFNHLSVEDCKTAAGRSFEASASDVSSGLMDQLEEMETLGSYDVSVSGTLNVELMMTLTV